MMTTLLPELARLETNAEARSAACSAGVRYIFRGAKPTHETYLKPPYLHRHLPSLHELQRSPSLEQVFASGEAFIFRVRPDVC
jgi:hypothetical protein